MKNINLKFFAVMVIAATLLSGCGLNKMVKNYELVKFETTPNPLEVHAGKVSVTVNGSIPEKYFHPKAIVEFTPVLKYNDQEFTLKTITLRGEKAAGDGIVISKATGGKFVYTDEIPYDAAMLVSELHVNPQARLGNKAPISLGSRKIADGVIATSRRVEKDEELSIAAHGYEKETLVTKSANLFFGYQKHNLDMNLALNKNEANRKALADLEAFLFNGWTIKSIEINAWASPEGETNFNAKLSENRGATADKYLKDAIARISKRDKTTLNAPAVKVTAKGEDFEGFMKALNASALADKKAIENVINSQLNRTDRERKIKDMTLIYAEIEKMLEPLRRAEFVVTSFEPKKTDAQMAELSTSNPSALNEKEILYAATLTEDLNTQLRIYKAAQQQFPQDYRAFNNAAVVNIKLGNIDDAAKDLEKANALAPNNGHVLNNLGVVATQKKDYANAKSYFEAAQGKGINTRYNMGNLLLREGDYQAALTSYAGKSCTHNIALVHLMSGNTATASSTLECAKKNAPVHYLMAVIGARTDNMTMMVDNLRKAIQMDAKYKECAKNDREFIKFFGRAEFQEIIK